MASTRLMRLSEVRGHGDRSEAIRRGPVPHSIPRCACGWEGSPRYHIARARAAWREHAVRVIVAKAVAADTVGELTQTLGEILAEVAS